MNLQIAATRLSAVAKNEAAVEGGSGLSVAIAVITAADAMMKDDIAANKAGQDATLNRQSIFPQHNMNYFRAVGMSHCLWTIARTIDLASCVMPKS